MTTPRKPRESRQPHDHDGPSSPRPASPQPGGPEKQTTYQPGWDLSVLENPVILDVPDSLPTDPTARQDPVLRACIDALALTYDHNPEAPTRIGDLARAGVVALRTSAGSLEVRETVLGWVLAHAWGDPDRHDLATAARLRARRLAGERHLVCGGPPAAAPAPDTDSDDRPRNGAGRSSDETGRGDARPFEKGAGYGTSKPTDDRDSES